MSADIDSGPCAVFFDVVASPVECQPALVHRHDKAYATAPAFYARLAMWYVRHGVIRGHYPIFAAVLIAADSEADRATGVGLLHHFTLEEVTEVLAVLQTYFGRVPRRFRTAVIKWLCDHEHADASPRSCRRTRRMLGWLTSQLRLPSNLRTGRDRAMTAKGEPQCVIPERLTAEWLREQAPRWVLQNTQALCAVGAYRAKRLRPILMEKWWQAMTPGCSDESLTKGEITGHVAILAGKGDCLVEQVAMALNCRMPAERLRVVSTSSPAAGLVGLRQAKVTVDHLVLLDQRHNALQALQPAYRVYRDTMRRLPHVLVLRERLAVPLALPTTQVVPWQVRMWSPDDEPIALAPLQAVPLAHVARQLVC